MSRDLTVAMQSEVAESRTLPCLLAEFEFDSGTLRMWSGIGDLVWNGNTFTGGGNLIGISPYGETTEMQAEGLTFTISGVPSGYVATALAEKYQMRQCRLYFGFFNRSYGQSGGFELEDGSGVILLESGDRLLTEGSGVSAGELVEDPYLLFSGLMDQMIVQNDGATSTIAIKAESAIFRLSQPNARYYTDQDQQAEFPGDRGFEFIPSLQNKQIAWGKQAA